MKTYSIGRDLNCDIVINDSTDVISRRHALINVTPSGKMTIIDQSSNGTYVNGIRISPNVAVPVTRKDVVSLAHVAKLDWNQVPRQNGGLKYLIAALVVVAIAFCIFFAMRGFIGGGGNPGAGVTDTTVVNPADSTKNDSTKNDTIKSDTVKDANAAKDAKDAKEGKKGNETKDGNSGKAGKNGKGGTTKSDGNKNKKDDKAKEDKEKKDKEKKEAAKARPFG